MKKKTTYKELTPESALELLQANDWEVEGIAFNETNHPRHSVEGTLVGMKEGEFLGFPPTGLTGLRWEYAWQPVEETVWEVGDRVQPIGSSLSGEVVVSAGNSIIVDFKDGSCASFSSSFLKPAPSRVAEPGEVWQTKGGSVVVCGEYLPWLGGGVSWDIEGKHPVKVVENMSDTTPRKISEENGDTFFAPSLEDYYRPGGVGKKGARLFRLKGGFKDGTGFMVCKDGKTYIARETDMYDLAYCESRTKNGRWEELS